MNQLASRNTFMNQPDNNIKLGMDIILFMLSLIIVLFGLVAVFSSSVDVINKSTGQPFYLLQKQSVYCLIAFLVGFVVYKIPMFVWYKTSPYLLIFGLFLLLLVLVPYIGKTVNGATRWLDLGLFRLQVSEPARLFFIIYMAGYLLRRNQELHAKFSGLLKPIFVFSLAACLLIMQPDFGATFVLFVVLMFMLFIAGVNLFQFILFAASMAGTFVLLIVTSTYRMQRITTFMDPWADPFNSGFQLTQSLIAFGSGGITGTGLGGSVQKLFYLPEAYNDFLLAIIAEELGAVGVIFVLFLFIMLIMRIFMIAKKAATHDKMFNAYVAYGIACWFMVQVFINFGVNMGLLPTKGLTLPLMSAGGSSMMIMLLSLALVMRIAYENDQATVLPNKRLAR